MLYTQDDYNEIAELRKKFWLKILIITLIFAAVTTVCSILRIDWPGYAAGSLWGIAIVFLWGMRGSKIRAYYRYLKDIREGLDKTITGKVEQIDKSVTSKDYVDFYTVTFIDDGAEPDSPSRRLYFDAAKGLPDFSEGDSLEVNLFGNNIKGFVKI